MRALLAAVLIAFLAGCAAKPVSRYVKDPSTRPPWRIAVLQAQLQPDDAKGKDERRQAKMMAEQHARLEAIRKCMAINIPADGFEVIPLPQVNQFNASGSPLPRDPEALRDLAAALQADLLLVPETHSWDRAYYLIHSVSRVGIDAKVYDGSTGELVFESMHEQTRNQGIIKIPIAPAIVVVGPILGLQGYYMADMCNSVSEKIGADLIRMYFATKPAASGEPAANAPNR